jgi:predicted amidohydrolase
LASPILQPDKDPGHFLNVIGKTARENDIDIVAGTVVEVGLDHVPHRLDETQAEDKEHDQKLFNTVYYVDRSGKVSGRYTKKVCVYTT